MEFSKVFGFLKLLKQSMKIILKNVKSIASIATVSLLLSSILLLLFSFSYQSLTAYMTHSITTSTSTSSSGGNIPFLQIIIFSALLLAVELTFLFAYIAVVHVSGIATVITTATSYTGTNLSLRDLWSTVKTKWEKFPSRRTSFRRKRDPMHILSIAAIVVAVPVVIFYPNPLTITIVSVAAVSIFVYNLYASVVPALAGVISVVEDGGEAAEAWEKSEKLVEGQRVDGVMVNLMFNIACLIAFGSSWLIVGDKGSLNLTVYGLFLINCVSAMRIILDVVYTMYYFQCKEYHGEEILLPFGDFYYTKLINESIP